ncbi:maf protein [Idiomarina xiamenensis 10-D-4]|uniref:7-methyl-GTP pyrophosphatase n=2 Tax=Idiomarina xiamenensis TaxID=1207041 RepID=K2KWS5_9GAMM|nr:maf protein [Idiomarina xiamenensis 10-D-4]
MRQLVLASTSPFRRELLEKLQLPFSCCKPQTDETPTPGESASDLVRRLAEAKARAVQADNPNALIIGSDQVAVIDEQILGKPGDSANAIKQLQRASGKRVRFYTGLALVDSRDDSVQVDVETFDVEFRQLSDVEIRGYVQLEQPFNCAGSFKSEGLGISLFNGLHGTDPNSLIGLPLIRLLAMLREKGVNPLLVGE